jgi:ParB family chromosome partitioning protein
LLSSEDLHELSEDIRENGLLNPIVLFESKVLDGRNRLLACKAAGVEPTFTEWVQNGVSAVAWVVSVNLKRRHLSSGQRAAVAVEAKPLLEDEAKQRQLAGLKQNRSIKNDSTDSPHRQPQVSKQVAKQCSVSEGYVYAAQKVREADEKLFQRVKAGTISLPDAQKALGHKVSTQAMVSSDSNEWYTPDNYLKTARHVLGDIDLDPASCELANKHVKANKIYTVDDDGLKHKWAGKVWLNPPYGDVGPKFAAKLIQEFEAGRVTEAILLVNSHVTDSKWFKPLFNYVLCFTDHRSKFWNQDGIGGAPTHGSVFVYFGNHPKKFADEFRHFGSVVQPFKL